MGNSKIEKGENKMNILLWIQKWYKEQCDGDWEHLYGVTIETLDNPGWSVDIELSDTIFEGNEFKTLQIHKEESDWIHCAIKDNVFRGRGDSNKLEKILMVFKEWVEEQ